MIGRTISHYRILEKLGEGGMGVVYKAEDTKLRRTVALKFLSPQALGAKDEMARFVHEAQAAAALNHPNICTIHEIDEAEGQTFIAMEYIEGRSLKGMIESGPLKLEEAWNIVIQIAEGLHEAHRRRIVHRDIKPANIMVTGGGRVKIMDFGLAKSPGRMQLTREGTTLGTVAYMSPEQGRGDEVDSRTDIWSLGVIIYEMVTGQRPFRGDYEQAVIYSIMNEDPEPVTSLRTGVPVELERISDRCMEKDPAERYQTAADLVADLRRLGRIMGEELSVSRSTVKPPPPQQQTAPEEPASDVSAPRKPRLLPWLVVVVLAAVLAITLVPRYFGTSEKSVEGQPATGLKMLAVIPFQNLGPPDDEYFADGITDAITARLAVLSGLGVISRQSAIQYKDGGKSTHQISEELGVDYILEGTIQRERPSDPTSRVRIIPQLIRCADDIHLWADTYDEDMTEVFRLQSEIAERVARELDVTLLEPERKALAEKPTENLEAYEFYLLGVEFRDRAVDMGTSRESVRMFEKAVELDPEFAIAWARLSRAYTWLYWMFGDSDALADARAAVDEAMRIDPDLLEGHLALGFLYYHGSLDYESALKHFNRVQKQRPGDSEANGAIGAIKRRQGKWEEALQHFERTFKVNPRSYMVNWDNLGNTYIALRRYDEAEKYIDRAMSLAPGTKGAYYSKAIIAILRDGDRELAKSYLQEMDDHTPPGEQCPPFAHIEPSIFRIARDSQSDRDDRTMRCIPSSALDSAVVMTMQAGRSVENNKMQEAVALLDSARVVLERSLQVREWFVEVNYSALSFVYAYLGRKEDAIRAAEWAVQLLPISKDAFQGPDYVQRLAEIYAIVGEYEAAIDQLEILFSVPSRISVHSLRLDPMWDPLRYNPRFQQLLDKYSGSGS
jgi:serine/threonine protein kinase/tetratricopeptide (TPR) repeat protein